MIERNFWYVCISDDYLLFLLPKIKHYGYTYELPYFGRITLSEDDYHKVEEEGIHSDNNFCPLYLNFSLLNIFRGYFDFTYKLVVHIIIVIVYL